MIRVEGLRVRAGNFLLGEIDLEVKSGEIHVLLGPTGSGKSTLLETVIGLRTPEAGRILLEGRDLTRLPVEKRGLGYLPQDLALFPHLSVRENILYGLKIRKRPSDGFVFELCRILDINHLLERRVTSLSGGERQRVALARALAPGFRHLLLDEPFSALHQGLRRELWDLLSELRHRYGLTVLLVTHDLKEAFFLGDTVSVIFEGRLEASGPPERLYRKPPSLRMARFFGLRNLFPGRVRQEGRVEVPSLGTVLRVTSTPPSRRKIYVGIHPEDVLVVHEKYLHPEQENLLSARLVNLRSEGLQVRVLFKGEGGGLLEVILPDLARSKLDLSPGCRLRLSLPPERIFLLEEEE